jgi:hypothetical protein
MNFLGMVDAREWPDRWLRLTEFGAASASAILWHRATAPRSRSTERHAAVAFSNANSPGCWLWGVRSREMDRQWWM